MRNEVDSLIHRWCGMPSFEGKDTLQLLAAWREIVGGYTESGRHYHTLDHLANMFDHFDAQLDAFQDPEAVSFAIFYHDIIYNPRRKDNEEQSARVASKKLAELGVAASRIERCHAHILATKAHQLHEDPDTNLLLDIDLGVLGANWDQYEVYARQVRKEYAIYPGFLYRKGRRKVLKYFLEKAQIYQTTAFQDSHEKVARENLARELAQLS